MKESDWISPPRIPILVVDDEEAIVKVLVRGLTAAGFDVSSAPNGAAAMTLLNEAGEDRFHALLTDIQMPLMRGDRLQQLAREQDPDLVVMMITAVEDIDRAVWCMREGVSDYVTKPFQLADIVVRLRSALEKRRLAIQVRDYQATLERRVAERSEQLQSQFLEALQSLSCALEAKDAYTHQHSERVCTLALRLADQCCAGDQDLRRQIETAARLHDIGKIGVPESVINKPGRLNPDERQLIQTHPTIGNDILEPLVHDPGVLDIVRHHHECWNGSGYPDGLAGEEIPLGARILAVADAFDAMTTDRAYRNALPLTRVLDIFRQGAGSQWDPQIVCAFLDLMQERLAA